MNIAIVGLGLIGGSFQKAALRAGHTVASLHHGDPSGAEDTELVLLALPPDAIAPWLRLHAPALRPGAVVVDAAGVKRPIMDAVRALPPGDWLFVGGHPMAGREVSGYAASTPDLFDGASMVLTPPDSTPPAVLDRLGDFFRSLGFARVVVTTPERHDALIAFTSQLGHVIATAYARDPLLPQSPGYTAGSFADMTRIATQDPELWTALYLANRDALLPVLDGFLSRLGDFREALSRADAPALRRLIAEGTSALHR